MKLNAAKQHYLTSDYYTFVDTPSGDSTIRTYTLDSNIKLSASNNLIGDLIIYSDKQMMLNGQLKNLKDRSGNAILPDAIWQISQAQPVINGLGLFDGYKYKAKIISGI